MSSVNSLNNFEVVFSISEAAAMLLSAKIIGITFRIEVLGTEKIKLSADNLSLTSIHNLFEKSCQLTYYAEQLAELEPNDDEFQTTAHILFDT